MKARECEHLNKLKEKVCHGVTTHRYEKSGEVEETLVMQTLVHMLIPSGFER